MLFLGKLKSLILYVSQVSKVVLRKSISLKRNPPDKILWGFLKIKLLLKNAHIYGWGDTRTWMGGGSIISDPSSLGKISIKSDTQDSQANIVHSQQDDCLFFLILISKCYKHQLWLVTKLWIYHFNYFNILGLHEAYIILVDTMGAPHHSGAGRGRELHFMFLPNQPPAWNGGNIVFHIIALILRHFKVYLK